MKNDNISKITAYVTSAQDMTKLKYLRIIIISEAFGKGVVINF